MDIVCLLEHDWGYRLHVGNGVRHAALLDLMIFDSDIKNLFWVVRVHPKKIIASLKSKSGFKRIPLFPFLGGMVYRIVQYAGRSVTGRYLLEHHLPHLADKLIYRLLNLFVSQVSNQANLFVGDPKEAGLISYWRAGRSIFDAMDNWSLAPEFSSKKKLIEKGYAAAAKADVITCNCFEAGRRFGNHKKLHVIANAGHIRTIGLNKELSGVAKPGTVVGLVGNYTDERINSTLLEQVIGKCNHISFFHAGNLDRAVDTKMRLVRYENFQSLGVLDYQDLQKFYNSIDLMIVPHRVSEYTLSQDSIKIYDAIIREVPVVSTAIHPAVDFASSCDLAELCSVADTADQMISAISKILAQKKQNQTRIIKEFANNHSWPVRYKALKALVCV